MEIASRNALPSHDGPTAPLNELSRISRGRDHVLTCEFGRAIGKADQTIRKNYFLTGEAYGVRPIKVGNRLLWPVAEIASLLAGEAA